jgi:hypothetical protein
MALEESSREDLLGEAKQLVHRVQIVSREAGDGDASGIGAEPIVVGFRDNGAFSVFFGEDPVYHFNAGCELRRAYSDGLLIKAVNGRLASLRRERTLVETQLVRHELSDEERSDFIAAMSDKLGQLRAIVEGGKFEIGGQVPPDADVIDEVRTWLRSRDGWPIADRPNV